MLIWTYYTWYIFYGPCLTNNWGIEKEVLHIQHGRINCTIGKRILRYPEHYSETKYSINLLLAICFPFAKKILEQKVISVENITCVKHYVHYHVIICEVAPLFGNSFKKKHSWNKCLFSSTSDLNFLSLELKNTYIIVFKYGLTFLPWWKQHSCQL